MARFMDMVGMMGGVPDWLAQIVASIVIAYTACVFGVAFGKMGRTPIWGLIFVVPFFGTIMLWVFGYGRWPQAEPNASLESGL